MATAKLYYFDGRGKAECIRLTLAAAGIEFTEEFTRDRSQFLKWLDEGKMVFKQLPVLEIDGKTLTQTGAILRYLGRKAGLYGKNDDEAVLVDMYFEGSRDFYNSVIAVGFKPEAEVLKQCKETALPRYLPIFNKLLLDNGTGYLVGSSLSLADISLLEPLLVFVEYFGKEILNDYPALQEFYNSQSAAPKMKAFLEGPQRKRKNTERYVSEVNASLDRA